MVGARQEHSLYAPGLRTRPGAGKTCTGRPKGGALGWLVLPQPLGRANSPPTPTAPTTRPRTCASSPRRTPWPSCRASPAAGRSAASGRRRRRRGCRPRGCRSCGGCPTAWTRPLLGRRLALLGNKLGGVGAAGVLLLREVRGTAGAISLPCSQTASGCCRAATRLQRACGATNCASQASAHLHCELSACLRGALPTCLGCSAAAAAASSSVGNRGGLP